MSNIHPLSERNRPLRDFTKQMLQSGNTKCLILDTPFHNDHVDGVPFNQVEYFENIDKEYKDIWSDIVSGNIRLVFLFTDWWHTVNANETHKQQSGNLISLDLYKVCYEFCKKHNILDNSAFISPSSINYLEQKLDWPIFNYNEPFNRYFEYTGEMLAFSNTSNIEKHFLWLNRRSREHRLYALHQAYKMNLFDNCLYSLHDLENFTDEEFIKFLSAYLNFEDINLEFRKLKKRLDQHYNQNSGLQRMKEINDLKYYSDKTYVDIIGEFNCSNQKVFLTEKTSRAIALGKPFVIFGDRGSLHELRSLGFRTFDKFWDESYDKLDTAKQRMDRALQTLDWIRNNIDITQGYSNEMIKVLEFNKEHYFKKYKPQQTELLRTAISCTHKK